MYSIITRGTCLSPCLFFVFVFVSDIWADFLVCVFEVAVTLRQDGVLLFWLVTRNDVSDNNDSQNQVHIPTVKSYAGSDGTRAVACFTQDISDRYLGHETI